MSELKTLKDFVEYYEYLARVETDGVVDYKSAREKAISAFEEQCWKSFMDNSLTERELRNLKIESLKRLENI